MLLKPAAICTGCPLYEGEYGKTWGYVPQSGTGDNGVLIILEAAGEEEENAGIPVVGKSGQYLFYQLQRVGIEREGFRIHNCLSCRPPNNKLIKQPYTESALAHCSPNLDATIFEHIRRCEEIGKTPVIVALGKFAFRRLMNLTDRDAIMHNDYHSYPHWNHKYGCWLLAAHHPSHLMQGKHSLTPTLQFVFKRALEIAGGGLRIDDTSYLLDPSPAEFKIWVDGYLAALKADKLGTFLSYDIETPYKSGKDEAEVAREDDDDYTILRCSFAYRVGDAVSVPWTAAYIPYIEQLFNSGGYVMGWNNNTYDDIRIMAQMPMNVVRLDAMLAWHVLNTAMPKGLGFVTPFYWKNTSMWKHLADAQPAFYNAKDADAALRCWLGIKLDLVENGLWEVFDRHVVQLNEVLAYMSRNGVLLDQEARKAAEIKLQDILTNLEEEMQAAVPEKARKLHVYKKEPKETAGLIRTEGLRKRTKCPICGALDIKAAHFKSIGKKRLAKGDEENRCSGSKADKLELPDLLWARPLPFKISKVGLQGYQAVMKHKAVKNREGKVTFDIKAIKTLIKDHPEDPLYPVIGKFRGAQKLLSTYCGVTEYEEIEVADDYQLQSGEKWKDA